MPVRPRVVIVDPQALVAEALETLLSPQCEIVGRASGGTALLHMVQEQRPDVAVMDIPMPLLQGFDAGRQAKLIDTSLKIVIVTASEDPDVAARAMREFASAYVLKRCASSELIKAIHEVMENRTYLTPLITDRMVHSLMDSSSASSANQAALRLTARQRQVLQLLAEGKSMKEAAHVLGITARTVAFHKYRMMEQLHINTNAELMRVAFYGLAV